MVDSLYNVWTTYLSKKNNVWTSQLCEAFTL